jgi:hypothetical protein
VYKVCLPRERCWLSCVFPCPLILDLFVGDFYIPLWFLILLFSVSSCFSFLYLPALSTTLLYAKYIHEPHLYSSGFRHDLATLRTSCHSLAGPEALATQTYLHISCHSTFYWSGWPYTCQPRFTFYTRPRTSSPLLQRQVSHFEKALHRHA